MKRYISCILFLVIVFTIWMGLGYAQDKTDAEEPWIYQDMGLLHQEGLIDIYPSEWVNSGNKLSRFEIAYYIKNFLVTNIDKRGLKVNIKPGSNAILTVDKINSAIK